MPMNWLRRIADQTATEDEQLAEAGYRIEATGPLGGRTYRLSPETIARRQAEAEQDRIRAMAQRAKEMFALAFPEQAADLARREALAAGEPRDTQ
jgi:hypothetical protein